MASIKDSAATESCCWLLLTRSSKNSSWNGCMVAVPGTPTSVAENHGPASKAAKYTTAPWYDMPRLPKCCSCVSRCRISSSFICAAITHYALRSTKQQSGAADLVVKAHMHMSGAAGDAGNELGNVELLDAAAQEMRHVLRRPAPALRDLGTPLVAHVRLTAQLVKQGRHLVALGASHAATVRRRTNGIRPLQRQLLGEGC